MRARTLIVGAVVGVGAAVVATRQRRGSVRLPRPTPPPTFLLEPDEPAPVVRLPRRRWRRKAYLLPLAAALALAVGVGTAAAWFVGVDGTAGGRIGGLEAVSVQATYGGDFLPGQDMPLRADVNNPNPLALKVSKLTVTGLSTDKDGCSIPKGKVDTADGLLLKPGKDTVVIATVHLPAGLPDECMGARVTADVSLKVAFGSGAAGA